MKVQHYSPQNLSPNSSNPSSPKNNKTSPSNNKFVAESYTIELKNIGNIPKLTEEKDLTKYFVGDKYGDCILSHKMENEEYGEIKKIFNLEELNDTEMLREFALKMCDESYREDYHIEANVARRIYGEATNNLSLLGENITDIVLDYNIPS